MKIISNIVVVLVCISFLAVSALSQDKEGKKSTEPKTELKKESMSTGKEIVEMKTSMGTIEIELYPDKAPKTVANFLSYVKDKFFDGTIFHRVINNFMIQGGGFTKDLKQKQTKPAITNEADNGLKNEVGTIAMARTPDPNSATSQFFINVKDNNFLNFQNKSAQGWGYCVFGKVINGMEVVNKIKAVKTGSSEGMQDVPVEPVVILSVRKKGDNASQKHEEGK
jgi:peptidyl-prolyl cis-trans isomerase B (cyclophilin B)